MIDELRAKILGWQLDMLVDDMDYVGPAWRLGYAETLAPLTYVYDCRPDLSAVFRHPIGARLRRRLCPECEGQQLASRPGQDDGCPRCKGTGWVSY